MGKYLCGIKYFFIAIFFIAGVWGCSDSEDSVGALELALTNRTVAATEIAQFATVECEGEWTLAFDYPEGVEAWCKSNQMTGKGKQQITLQYSQNMQEESRIVVICLSSGNQSVTVELTQRGIGGSNGNEGDNEDVYNPGWLELPKLKVANQCRFLTHYVKVGAKQVRNFSLFFDTNERIAYWVAYPHCKMYIGSQGRTDAFQPDPEIEVTNQMSASLPESNYIYNRGHQIPSADRTANYEMNVQTFYYSNMTPQLGSFNQRIWVDMETKVRNWLNSCDTLYVVTGAVLKTVGGNEVVKYTADRNGQQIAIPNYYFKVLLQLRLNNGSPSYQAIGFWFDHKANNGAVTSTYARTIDYIEEKTGFDFFSNLPQEIQDQVENRFEPEKWGIN